MNDKLRENELFQTSHIVILFSYSIFSVVLIGEGILLSWEPWALVMVAVGFITAWIIHVQQRLSAYSRSWIYSVLMMATFFFYGIHKTSTYDMTAIMMAVITLYTMTGIKSLVTLCQVTYFLTFGYDIVRMIQVGDSFTPLVTTRSLLHFLLVIMSGGIARIIIDRWEKVLSRSHEEIEALRDGTERLNDFLANVSHEIRTPVNAVIGLTRICMERERDPDIRRDMSSVMEAGVRVGDQIGDILDFSEIDRGRLARNDEDYELASVLQDLVAEFRSWMQPDIELVIDVDPQIPVVMNTDVSKLKKVIRHLISNSFKYTKSGGIYLHFFASEKSYGTNLCIEVSDTGIGMEQEEQERIFEGFFQGDSSRARVGGGLGLGMSIVYGFVSALGGFMTVKSKPQNGTTIRVSLPQKVVSPQPCMSLTDPERLALGAYICVEKYTDPNVREYYARMMRNLARGLGVEIHRVDSASGLRTLKDQIQLTHLLIAQEEYEEDRELLIELAREMDVVLCARSEEVSGNLDEDILFMEKPAVSFQVVEFLNRNRFSSDRRTGEIRLRGVRALVVDDEPMNLVVAREILNRYEMDVFEAESGLQAVEFCRIHDYDIVFMDHMMPGMDGIEAMRMIRAERDSKRNKMPIIALTANAVSTAKEMFFAEGFDGFVSKPIVLSELERAMVRVLPSSRIEYVPHTEREIPALAQPVEQAGNGSENKAAALEGGLDRSAGLAHCMQDEDFYMGLLDAFCEDGQRFYRNLEDAFRASDPREYRVYADSVRNTAALIGAGELEAAAESVLPIVAGNAMIDGKRHEKLMRLYKSTLSAARYAG